MSLSKVFNESSFSHFLNSPSGRVFRIAVGIAFIVVGFFYRSHTLGILAIIWGFFPLSAGAFDVCYMSFIFGGPLSGEKIRSQYKR